MASSSSCTSIVVVVAAVTFPELEDVVVSAAARCGVVEPVAPCGGTGDGEGTAAPPVGEGLVIETLADGGGGGVGCTTSVSCS